MLLCSTIILCSFVVSFLYCVGRMTRPVTSREGGSVMLCVMCVYVESAVRRRALRATPGRVSGVGPGGGGTGSLAGTVGAGER